VFLLQSSGKKKNRKIYYYVEVISLKPKQERDITLRKKTKVRLEGKRGALLLGIILGKGKGLR